MSIRIFATGGTFDKEYHEISGELYFRTTQVPEMLRKARCAIPVAVTTLMMKDSLYMTPDDRLQIARACAEARESRIVVTHGTDTMVETAGTVAKHAQGKTVVFTGALVPYAFGSLDGPFNLGMALAFAQKLPSGVYIAMNGRALKYNRVRKNNATGVFEEIT